MNETGESSHLLGPGGRASGRHHRLLVPTQESQGPGQVHDLAQLELQPIVRCFNHSTFPSPPDVNSRHLRTTVSRVRSRSDRRSEVRLAVDTRSMGGSVPAYRAYTRDASARWKFLLRSLRQTGAAGFTRPHSERPSAMASHEVRIGSKV